MGEIQSVTVERADDDSYTAVVQASFEKRNLTFSLTAEESVSSYGGTSLVPTELSFVVNYSFGEKMEKAALNTLMGMGTVFLVLIFISLIISSFKKVNEIEANVKAKKAGAEAPAAAPAPVQTAAPAAAPARTAAPAAGGVTITSPMPGKILGIKAAAGTAVKRGQVILLLEAMKMENEIVAPQDGTVASVNVAVGDMVEPGAVLATLN